MSTPTVSARPSVKVRALNCPNCGAPLAIHGFAHTLNIACGNCLSILDAKDPNFRVLSAAQHGERIPPRIPLGTRGVLRGEPWQAIGFQERTIEVEGVPYSWYEYLLFNPYKGFRYLTEYCGHWNYVTTLRSLPEEHGRKRPTVEYGGETFRHFQTALARTTYIIGEFPWQVRLNDAATVQDFVAPPRMLSKEAAAGEFTWSLGEYISGREVWQAFQLPGHPPSAEGIFADQPSPLAGKVAGLWAAAVFALIALFLLMTVVMAVDRNEQVFERTYSYSPRAGGEPSIVTDMFDLNGRQSAVEVKLRTDLSNNWAYFRLALINADTGEARDFGREVSYYFGRDSDGNWTEGNTGDTALIPSVPPGRYYLRIEPEMEPAAPGVTYYVTVTRDVPAFSFFWIALPLLLLPPVFVTIRSLTFEHRRWQESDYAAGSDGDD